MFPGFTRSLSEILDAVKANPLLAEVVGSSLIHIHTINENNLVFIPFYFVRLSDLFSILFHAHFADFRGEY